jgi:hypothetical protein
LVRFLTGSRISRLLEKIDSPVKVVAGPEPGGLQRGGIPAPGPVGDGHLFRQDLDIREAVQAASARLRFARFIHPRVERAAGAPEPGAMRAPGHR